MPDNSVPRMLSSSNFMPMEEDSSCNKPTQRMEHFKPQLTEDSSNVINKIIYQTQKIKFKPLGPVSLSETIMNLQNKPNGKFYENLVKIKKEELKEARNKLKAKLKKESKSA